MYTTSLPFPHSISLFISSVNIIVAIVIAPTAKPSIGIFRLTDPPGLSIISNCKQGNDFHPHYEVGPLYVDAYAGGDEDEEEGRSSRDGHVVVVRDKVKCRLIDLR